MKILYYKLRAFAVKWIIRVLPRNIPLVFSGTDSSLTLCRQLATLGYGKALIVTDRFFDESGLLDGIKSTLSESGVSFTVFDGVEPDPDFEQVQAGEAVLRKEKCDAVIAIGGGSVMDAAKLIALLHRNPGDLAFFDGIQKAKHPGLPLFVIPTTAGTGSETSPASVITDSKTHRKVAVADGKLVPHYVALDAGMMKSMPPRITASSGMDALTHAVESCLSKASTDSTEAMARAAVRLTFQYLARAWRDGNDMQAREAMAMASFYAGVAFGRTSVGYAHGIAHQLGRVCSTPHGEANAMVLPEVLTAYGDCVHERLAVLARAAGLGEAGDTADKLAGKLIDGIAALRRELEMPLVPEGLEEADIPGIVKAALAEAGDMYPVPRYLSAAELGSIVRGLM
ncbi:MAG: iron-containing alcohol dehydrogenase [Xanthomonadales bacterium]|nr:iron-containing alcohol dehydrogenase [Xanthomonadales bacterium]